MVMDKDERRRALQFLHTTGWVLEYRSGKRQHSRKLQGVVFMQPQFIVDVIEYVIRESKAEDVNDELRDMDAQIRRTTLEADLGLLLEKGELSRSLLKELWAKFEFTAQDLSLLLDLMEDIQVVVQAGHAGR